jgi:MFS family permease
VALPIANSFRLLARPDYRRLWAVGALTGAARWLEFVALAIFAYQLTRSPEMVASLSVLRMLPYVVLGLFVGALADAFDRRRLLIGAMCIVTGLALGMAALCALDLAGFLAVALATMVSGILWTVDMPVRRRLMVDAVDASEMASGLGLDNATTNATRAIGPMVGGLTYAWLGIQGIYLLIAACYGVCIVLALGIGRARPAPISELEATSAATPAGWRSILPPVELLRDRRFLIIMGVTLVYNLWCFPFVTMVPVIAQKDFGLSPTLVGLLSACDGIGGTFGALLVGSLVTERTMFRWHFAGVLAFLLLVLFFSWHLEVGTAIGILFALGMASAAFASTQYALVYLIAPPHMRGRATGILTLFIGSSMLGHLHAGYLFERLGSMAAMQLMALEGLVLLTLIGIAWRFVSRSPPAVAP